MLNKGSDNIETQFILLNNDTSSLRTDIYLLPNCESIFLAYLEKEETPLLPILFLRDILKSGKHQFSLNSLRVCPSFFSFLSSNSLDLTIQ